jgi:DNA-binding CsgD family transcriptional regulator
MSGSSEALSEREKETLRLLLTGHDVKSIASSLGLSVHTVNERLREARRKLGASSSRQAARVFADLEQRDPDFSVRPNFPVDKKFGVGRPVVRTAINEHSNRPLGNGAAVVWFGGGMLIMSLIVAVAILSSTFQVSNKTVPSAPTQIVSVADSPISSESAGSAREWLALVDGQHWDESWSAAGTLFRSSITSAIWASKVQPVRQPLGSVSSRVLQNVTKATSLPGAPDGHYEVLRFATSFAHKANAIETVTLAHEPSGWRVDGYFIK